MRRHWQQVLSFLPFLVACAAGPTAGNAPTTAPATVPAPAATAPAGADPRSDSTPADTEIPPAPATPAPGATSEAPAETLSDAPQPAASAPPTATEPPPPPPLPSEVLTAPRVAFLLDEPGSELKEHLTARCAAKIPEADLAERAACRQELRDEFTADVFVFRRAPGGGIRWQIYQRQGSTLREVHAANVQLMDETPSSFSLRTLSAKGVRPIGQGQRELPLTMPTKNELVLADPEFGRLVYRAKFGLVGD